MNFKCKFIFNINIIKILIIHVAINFNGNHTKQYRKKLRKKRFIMNFWNDEINLSCRYNEKCEFRKCHSNVKIKKKIKSRVRYIENFPIQNFLIKKNLRFMKQNDLVCYLYVCTLKNVVSFK
jgi:hypothetical protein